MDVLTHKNTNRPGALIALAILMLVLLTGCATTPRSESNAVGKQIAAHALAMNGKPYRYGGNGPASFDCSGLVHFAHRQSGVDVPRTTATQYRQSHKVAYSAIQPGDLLFFRISGKLAHVGLYTGNGQFVHAPGSGRKVTTAKLDNPYWQRSLVAAGRLY